MTTKELTALQLLNQLERNCIKAKYPNVPEWGLVFQKYTDKTTNGLTRCVMDWLRLNNYHVERTGNEGRIIDKRKTYKDVIGNTRTIGGIQRVYSTSTRGTSDLKAIINGKFVAIEIKCKQTNDRQGEAQKEYQKRIEASGGVYIIVTDFKSFYEWFVQFIRKGLQDAK